MAGSGLAIGPLGPGDEAEATEVLAQAFRDGPLDRAVVGASASRRLRAGRAGMGATLVAARGRADLRGARRDGRLEGVLLALPPWGFPLPPPPIGVQLRSLLRQGFGVARRWREVFEALEARHPHEPCFYLSLLGVDPAQQGRGVGSALLAAWLAEVDADAKPAFLETARQRNCVLYERFGFEVREEFVVLGVPVWSMVRPPRVAV